MVLSRYAQVFFAGSMLASAVASADVPKLPLFRTFPSLEQRLPRVVILKGYTPVEPLAALENKLYSEAGKTTPAQPMLWVKRDDGSANLLGGNKARKLEFLMADANLQGARKLVTSGMYGSNHALATAAAAKQLGFKVRLILGPQPVTEDVRKKVLAFHALGAKLSYHGNRIAMGLDMMRSKMNSWFTRKIYYIPPGGSTEVGEVGYVNAFMELADQMGANLPEQIVVPVGSMGTAAGLLVGTCLSGNWEKVKILGVGVADPLFTSEGGTRSEARDLYKFIKKRLSTADLKKLPVCNFKSKKAFGYTKAYYAPGYGAAKSEVFEAIRFIKNTENLTLEATYSGKAMLFMLDELKREVRDEAPVKKTLFWLTYNSFDLDQVINSHAWSNPAEKWRDLPKPFWKFFEEKPPGRRGD